MYIDLATLVGAIIVLLQLAVMVMMALRSHQ